MDKQLRDFIDSTLPAVIFVVSFWLIHGLKYLLGASWITMGIYPRAMDGLWGIFTAPFIHADLTHLTSNSMPFLLTGSFMMLFFPTVAKRAFVMLYFFTGLMVWFFARESYHIGASGVVYAMVSFLFWSGVFRRSNKSIFLALSILILYGSMFEGILPKQEHVSWESHLFGGLVGILVAYYFKNQLEDDEQQKSKWEHIPYSERPYFFNRDVFVYTKAQRIAMEEERIRAEEAAYQQYLYQQQLNQWNSDHT
jgi:membrane associated rhomboid family serine protease